MTNDPFKKNWTQLEGNDLNVVKNAKEAAENLLVHFNSVSQSREISLAKTNLEQAMMWFTKGFVLEVDSRASKGALAGEQVNG